MDGTQVGALVFYGRRRYMKLLNMYLERNLAINGGILDEVSSLHCCEGYRLARPMHCALFTVHVMNSAEAHGISAGFLMLHTRLCPLSNDFNVECS